MFQVSSDDRFLKNFLVSVAGHGLLVLVSFLGGKFLFKGLGPNDIEIIRSSVRVDVVGMPKFTVQELKELQKTAPVTATEVPEPQGAPEVKKVEAEDVIKEGDLVIQQEDKRKKKASFLSLVADYSSKKVAAQPQPKGTQAGAPDKSLESLVVEGNRLSKGSALVGDFSDEAVTEFSAYVQTIPELIRPHWKLPSYLLEKDHRCRIRIYLSKTGAVLKFEVLESSGSPEFDARAERSIRDAAPFPRPTDTVGTRLANSGIVLGFPL